MDAGETVLLVDGEILVRHEIAAYLRDCGYVVLEAADTDEALTVLSEPHPPVDIVLCDANVGGSLNGFALSKWVRENRPELGVLLAGNLERAVDAAGELCDEGPQLARPYDPSIVADRIRQHLARRDRTRDA